VFKASDTPFFSGLYVSSRPMIAALVMAVSVRYLLHVLAERIPSATLQVLVGAAVGGIIYAVLILLTERALLGKILGMVKSRRMRENATQG
jgi:succinoglycan exporter